MSQENSQGPTGTAEWSSVGEHVQGVAGDTNSFAELIRAREDQQRRIRDALEEQNRQLRARLATEGAGLQGDSKATSPGVPSRHRTVSSSAKSQVVIPVEEFITFVTEMKDLVNCAQQADLVALHALQDRVDFHNRYLAQRMTELEAQMIALQRRDEHLCTTTDRACTSFKVSSLDNGVGEPCLQYVLQELENVRKRVDDAMERVRLSDEIMERQQAAFHHRERDLNTLEAKIADLDATRDLFRREAIALEGRYTEFSRRLRQDITQQQQQSTGVLEEHLWTLERRMAALEGLGADEAKAPLNSDVLHEISSLVEEKSRGIRETLEDILHTKIMEMDKRGKELDDAMGNRLAEFLTANAATIKELIEKLKTVEVPMHVVNEVPKIEAPVPDEQRIEVLTKELKDATVVLESAIAQRASSTSDGIILESVPLSERLEKVEGQVNVLEEKINYVIAKQHDIPAMEVVQGGRVSRLHSGVVRDVPASTTTTAVDAFASICANGDGTGSDGYRMGMNTKDQFLHRGTSSQLPTHSWLAEATEGNSCTNAFGQPCVRFDIPVANTPCETQLADTSPSLQPPPYTPSSLAVRARIRPASHEPSSPLPFGPFLSPPLPISSQNTVKKLQEIRERRRQKEGAVVKVIASIREIEKLFSNLSEKESSIRRCSTSSRSATQEREPSCGRTDAPGLLELIANQKEAVHAKRKELLGLRNSLWRGISELDEEERDLLAS